MKTDTSNDLWFFFQRGFSKNKNFKMETTLINKLILSK